MTRPKPAKHRRAPDINAETKAEPDADSGENGDNVVTLDQFRKD